MIDNKALEDVKEKLIKTYDPLFIYLFGSYAWGTPDDESDLDLLIIIDHYNKDRHQTLVDGYRALIHTRGAKDLLVVDKNSFEKDSLNKTTLCYKIKKQGKQIYAKA